MVIGAITAAAVNELPETLEIFQPLVDVFRPFFLSLSVVMGGIFGLYIILILIRVHYERKKVKILLDIRYNLDKQNLAKGLSYSRERRRFRNKLIAKIKKLFIRHHDYDDFTNDYLEKKQKQEAHKKKRKRKR